MEGKANLFKTFADIDVFDLEVGSENPDDVIKFCQLLEPTVGGINLEDIRAPDCFYIEETLRKTLKIPVFHDDQHGTAIISGAALLNALECVGKDIRTIKVVFSGAGAAAISTAEHYVRLGVERKNIILCDRAGVITRSGRDVDPYRLVSPPTRKRARSPRLVGADVFVGLSVRRRDREMIRGMAPHQSSSRSPIRSRNSAGGSSRRSRRRHHRHRPERLPEPG
jgi:malate dehydrogenase (oxaloacetate-decarboxylating)(NADP+)